MFSKIVQGIVAGTQNIDCVTGRIKIHRGIGSSDEDLRLGMDMLSGNEALTGKESIGRQGSKRKDKVVRNDMEDKKCEEAEILPKEERQFSRKGLNFLSKSL